MSAAAPVIAPMALDGRTLAPSCWFRGTARSAPARCVVWHWTAGVGRAERVASTLRSRGLSIHFVIDPDGRVVQMGDVTRRMAHAGAANGQSVGVEVVSPGTTRAGVAQPARRPVDARVHGRTVRVWSWTEEQARAIVSLADWLSDALAIPRAVPAGDVRAREATWLRAWRGHLEHAHVTARKADCAGLAVELLAAHGYERRS